MSLHVTEQQAPIDAFRKEYSADLEEFPALTPAAKSSPAQRQQSPVMEGDGFTEVISPRKARQRKARLSGNSSPTAPLAAPAAPIVEEAAAAEEVPGMDKTGATAVTSGDHAAAADGDNDKVASLSPAAAQMYERARGVLPPKLMERCPRLDSVEALLEHFAGCELLCGDEAYECDKCHERSKAVAAEVLRESNRRVLRHARHAHACG